MHSVIADVHDAMVMPCLYTCTHFPLPVYAMLYIYIYMEVTGKNSAASFYTSSSQARRILILMVLAVLAVAAVEHMPFQVVSPPEWHKVILAGPIVADKVHISWPVSLHVPFQILHVVEAGLTDTAEVSVRLVASRVMRHSRSRCEPLAARLVQTTIADELALAYRGSNRCGA